MQIKGTKSEQNLRDALMGESLARNKYTYYAMTARKNGHTEVAEALDRMAQNEMMHAKIWFDLCYGASTETKENLMEAAKGELGEWHSMYPGFAKQAREDGLEDLAVMFERVASIEKDHERQFMTLIARLSGGNPESIYMAQKAESGDGGKQYWRCQFCGAVFDHRPDVCDTCRAIGAFEAVTD